MIFFKRKESHVGRMRMSHLIADSTEELIEIIEKIGVDKKWIQHKGTPKEHFDICFSARMLAIQNGAIEITYKALTKMVIKRKDAEIALRVNMKIIGV